MARRPRLPELLLAAAVSVVAACGAESGSRAAAGEPAATDSARVDSVRADSVRADSARADSAARAAAAPAVALVPPPPVLRALYVNRWAALGEKMWQLIAVARTTEINGLVIDVKDDRGFVLYRSEVPLARAIGADTNRPMSARRLRAVLDTMRAHAILPIARIVVAKDPLLAERKPEWAIRSRRDPASPWLDRNGKPWLDAHQPPVWQYAVDLAREAVAHGFSEIQLDYMRFPDEKGIATETVYPLANGRVRATVIRDQLDVTCRAIRQLGVRCTGDVFGLTATDTTDMGIGQQWEMFVDRMDVVLPMAYPSHYAPGTYGLRNPNASPYATIDNTLRDATRRSAAVPGAALIVPWYQDFTLGPPRYGAAQVRAQIEAGYANDVYGWVLWNPRTVYTLDALRKGEIDPAHVAAQRAADSARTAPRAAPAAATQP